MDIRKINRQVIEQFRAGGPVDGMQRERLLLLTTTGRKSGNEHICPMMFHRDGDRLLVIASNMGATRHPAWYLNLMAHPEVGVEIGDSSSRATASTLTGSDRTQIWTSIKAAYPYFEDHELKAGREIPVVVLTPARRRHHRPDAGIVRLT